jgi:hypothetical protein
MFLLVLMIIGLACLGAFKGNSRIRLPKKKYEEKYEEKDLELDLIDFRKFISNTTNKNISKLL